MRVLHSWLKRYVPFSLPPEALAEKLTMLGLEFESIEHLGDRYEGFVVGEVIDRSPHPNADRLTVCVVNTGKQRLQIVCGAPNVAPGQKVAVGLAGATIPRNQHDPEGKPFVLANVRIRGVESSGMICSEYELGLGKDAEGILVLDDDAVPGEALAKYFGMDDVAYDVEITPNRPDWLSHVGVAREIGVIVKKRVRLPRLNIIEGRSPIEKSLSVTVKDRENCLRFAARVVRGVKIGPSPRWLGNALRNVGLRPRNNVVDITNFVMMECGQPMHAFDYALLRGRSIVIRRARPGTPFTTLDGKSQLLPGDAVMVCDAEREVSIAGIMGGANSEINDATTDVVLESACWNPSSIRRTSRALGITSDASQRFERGGDPGIVPFALDRAASLVAELAGGEILKGMIDVRPRKPREIVISLRPERANAVLGTRLSDAAIVRSLRQLEVERQGTSRHPLRFKPPSFRVDLEREIDLIEEVARVYGYDNIQEKMTATIDFSHPVRNPDAPERVRQALIGAGFQESITNSMQDEKRAALEGKQGVRILNPQSQDMSVLRTSLVPGLLDAAARNESFGNVNLRLFEIGHVFSVDDSAEAKLVGDFLEEERVCFLMSGLAEPRGWSEAPRAADLFDLKGEVEDFLRKIALDKGRFISYSTSNGLTDNSLAIEIHGSYAGYLGSVKEDVLKLFGVGQPVFLAELSLEALSSQAARMYRPLPRYPRVNRDVAFVVDVSVSAGDLMNIISESAGDLLSGVELFDLFEGESLGKGKKSLAFSLELLSPVKTLTDPEIEAVIRNIVQRVEKETGAAFRDQ